MERREPGKPRELSLVHYRWMWTGVVPSLSRRSTRSGPAHMSPHVTKPYDHCVCIYHHRLYCLPHHMVRDSRSEVVHVRGWFRVPTLSPLCPGSPAFRSVSFFFYCSTLYTALASGNSYSEVTVVRHSFARGQ